MKRYIVGITGASGSMYAVKLIEALLAYSDAEIHLVITKNGERVLAHETGLKAERFRDMALPRRTAGGRVPAAEAGSLEKARLFLYDVEDLSQSPASGSFLTEGMIVVPCSMGTLADISSGTAKNLLTRAADVCLKEGRPLILVPRETPLSTIHLQNMLRAREAGAVILPAMPAFYQKPVRLDDCFDFIAGKILNLLRLPQERLPEWIPHP